MTGMPMRRGVHGPLEDAADAIIKESLRDTTRHADKSDILTPWKMKDRLSREVYVPSGRPDATLRAGNFGRVYNPRKPHLNSREAPGAGRSTPNKNHIDESGFTSSMYQDNNSPSWDNE